jgi:hypothetical protein
VNLLCFDTTGYYNLPAQGVICLHKLSYGLGGADKAMNLPVMTQPDRLLIGDSKVNARYWPLIPTLQLSQPLM